MRTAYFHTLLLCQAIVLLAAPDIAHAQRDVAAKPIVGLRDERPSDYALIHADVVVEPGVTLDDVTILIRGTAITAIGPDIAIPDGSKKIDCKGKRVYAGLIDAWSEVESTNPETKSGYWNSNVTPQRNAAESAVAVSDASKLRSQGITARLVAPKGGIVKGTSSVVLLDGSDAGRTLLRKRVFHHLQLSVPRSGPRESYPNSPMGATALLRQAMYDAIWYRDAWDAYQASAELPRPETNLALQELSQAMSKDRFVVDAPNERMAVRADTMAREFSLPIILRGSGREYRALPAVIQANRPILVPIDFPDAPDVKTPQSRESVTLQELMHWDLAPENPGRLAAAGLPICLTTDGLSNVGDFLKQVRVAVDRGLEADAALAAITTTPAELMQIDDHVGRVQVGKLANLVIADGDLFDSGTKVLESWVAGKRFEIDPKSDHAVTNQLAGQWTMKIGGDQAADLRLVIEEEKDKLQGRVTAPSDQSKAETPSRDKADDDEGEEGDDAGEDDDEGDDGDEDEEEVEDEEKPLSTKLKNVARERDRVVATLNLHEVDPSFDDGISLLTVMMVDPSESESTPDLFATITLPNGVKRDVDLRRLETADEDKDAAEEESKEESPEKESQDEDHESDESDSKKETSDATEDAENESEEAIADDASTPLLVPLGAYGRQQPIAAQPTVLLRGATLWTCDEAGVLETADLLIKDGLIAAIGDNLEAPIGCQVFDVQGKHVTPGLIDCHSHMGTDGGVNESGQVVTAEVRIGDFIDNSDINIYRHLAGGVTTSNILHGSANPIGGQNQVIKLRWGDTMDGLRMKEAPKGIKFALGENVKRSQSRYPNTRMGVEQIIRDQLLAAREYQSKWRRWRDGERASLPPRVDLQLEALSEVQQGSRWVHCHSYRQDEIVATLNVLEEFGIQIGTLQHILEGYKVADKMAQHGAMGSAFSDWWAYKFEVLDAIPYNGALMHERGVVVSFNSDDRELARHLNTEAAKATKYGGVPEEEALKFVTLNPARQLRIDQYVGSLTVGKQADLVVWSGRPLSTMTRCEQSWIDGRRYFDLKADSQLRDRDAQLHARLLQKALGHEPTSKQSSAAKEVAEEDRWVRTDIYCTVHGGVRHETIGSGENQ